MTTEKKKKIAIYSFEKVKETFSSNNCKLLSTNYKNNKDVLKFICKCKVETEISFKKYLVQLCCNECHKSNLTRRFKYTFDEVKKTFEDNNCKLVSTEYINQVTNLDYICECKNEAKITFKMFLTGQRCQKCAVDRRKETNLQIYGNEVSMNSEKLKEVWTEKIKNRTEEEKEEIQNKRKVTNLEKYGVEHSLQSKDVRDKGKVTNLEKYGVEHALQSKEIRDKGKKTMIEKFKVEYAMQSDILQEKMKETNLEKYGYEYTTIVPEFKEKMKETSLERYGYEYPMQNAEISEKQQKNSHHTKKYTLPSGTGINIQGYENYAMDILLKEFKEDEILNARTDMPVINYIHKKVNRRYFPDIYIPKINKIIEVKSTWTYQRDLIKNLIKAIYTRQLGYDYEVWIFDKKELIHVF